MYYKVRGVWVTAELGLSSALAEMEAVERHR